MAWLCTGVATQSLALSASLLTWLRCVFALAGSMAIFLAEMGATFKRLTTDLTTACIYEPTRHIFHHLLTTKTVLLSQEWTLRTSVGTGMAIMRRLRVTTRLWPLTRERARWWLSTAWLWRIQDGSSAITRNLLEDGFSTGIARALVAELWACMSSAFQRSIAHPRANMFCFNVLVERAKVRFELLA